MMLFSGLAAKVHCQSGFAPRTAGFHQTPPQTSHSKRHPEVTESVRDITSAAAPCQSQGRPGRWGVTVAAQLNAAISVTAEKLPGEDAQLQRWWSAVSRPA